MKIKVDDIDNLYDKPQKSSYCYEFNKNGTLNKEGLFLWDEDPLLDDSDYFDECIQYDSLGRYIGIWKEKSFRLSSVLCNISRNRSIRVLKENGGLYKYKYKGYMYCLDKESYRKSEGWILFDDLMNSELFKYSIWIDYDNKDNLYKGFTIYDKKGFSIFYPHNMMNKDVKIYPPLYKIE